MHNTEEKLKNLLIKIREEILETNNLKSSLMLSDINRRVIDISEFVMKTSKSCELIAGYIAMKDGMINNYDGMTLSKFLSICKENSCKLDNSLIEYLSIIKDIRNIAVHGYILDEYSANIFFKMFDLFIDWFYWDYLFIKVDSKDNLAKEDFKKFLCIWLERIQNSQNDVIVKVNENNSKIDELSKQLNESQGRNKIGFVIFIASIILSAASIIGMLVFPLLQNGISYITSLVLAIVSTIGGVNIKKV